MGIEAKSVQQGGEGGAVAGGNGEPVAPLTSEAVEKLLEARENKLAAELRRFRDNETKARNDLAQKLTEQLAAFKAPVASEGGVDGAGDDKETPAQKELRIATKKQADRIKALEAQVETEKAERQKVEAAKVAQEERSATVDALAAGGVSEPGRVKAALAVLREEGKIGRNEQGVVCWKAQGKYGPEDLPLADGIKAWLATDEGKFFLPPRDARGGGTAPGRPGAVRQGPRSSGEWASDMFSALDKGR